MHWGVDKARRMPWVLLALRCEKGRMSVYKFMGHWAVDKVKCLPLGIWRVLYCGEGDMSLWVCVSNCYVDNMICMSGSV